VNAEQVSKKHDAQADSSDFARKADASWEASDERTGMLRRDIGGGMHNKGDVDATRTREALSRDRT
jgi:hypothetical protein